MKIVGVYPLPTPSQVDARGTIAEPLGLGRVLAVAERMGFEVVYVMMVGDDAEAMAYQISAHRPDIVAFSLMTCQMPLAEAITSELKKSLGNVLVVAGGYHPSVQTSAHAPFDAFFRGEGERAFEVFLSNIRDGLDWRQSPGLTLRDGTQTNPPERLSRIEDYPWSLRSEEMLRSKCLGLIHPSPSEQTGFAYVDYGRGCKGSCDFCCKNVMWGNTVTYRSPVDIVDEMFWLQEEKDVNLFTFSDLNFTASHRRVHELCDEITRRSFDASWFCMSNVNTASRGILDTMSEAGCVKIMYGVESIWDDTLRRLPKRQNHELEHEILQETLDSGIVPHIFYMVGFPWETPADIEAAIDPVCSLPGLQLRVQIATPLPGSLWYKEMGREEVNEDYALYDCEHLVYDHPYFTETALRQWVDVLYRRFYESPAYGVRVGKFLAGRPRFETSFTEFAMLLESERGIHVGF